MPAWVTWPMRLLIALCRSFHQVIIAIMFVKAVGFGALAGILALTVASIGFVAKLFAEAIEEISLKQVEAIRATGALVHERDQLRRDAAGARRASSASPPTSSTPTCATPPWSASSARAASAAPCSPRSRRFDYDYLLTILLAIIAMIMVSEMLQNWIKRLYQ